MTTTVDLSGILERHLKWLRRESGGERADLGGANLRSADLGGADLGGANLRSADLGGANLRSADLGGANLGGANLYGANLGGANLRSADLGDHIVLQIGPIGSRRDYLQYCDGVVRTGCFSGSLAQFAAAVNDTHGDNEHGQHYRAAITLLEPFDAAWQAKQTAPGTAERSQS